MGDDITPDDVPLAGRTSDGRSAPNMLDYARAVVGRTVAVSFCGNQAEAELQAAELAGAGIPCLVANVNTSATLSVYIAGSRVEVQVMEADAERAREVLRKLASPAADDELEPVEGPAGQPRLEGPPPLDEQGRPAELAEAARFDNPRLMREAAVLLESARITCHLPKLAPRGDRPRGQGKRFVLRVAEDDLERAERVLAEAEEEGADDEEPRCPKCGSWRVAPVSQFWRTVRRMLLGAKDEGPAGPQMECLQCRHRWPVA